MLARRLRLPIALLLDSLGLAACNDDGDQSEDFAVKAGADLSNTAKDLSTHDGGDVTLKVFSYMSRCSVAVNGAAAKTDEVQTFVLPPDTVVNLSAKAADASTVFKYWFATDGDLNGVFHDQQMTTTITLNTTSGHNATVGDRLVQACCVPASDSGATCPAPK